MFVFFLPLAHLGAALAMEVKPAMFSAIFWREHVLEKIKKLQWTFLKAASFRINP